MEKTKKGKDTSRLNINLFTSLTDKDNEKVGNYKITVMEKSKSTNKIINFSNVLTNYLKYKYDFDFKGNVKEVIETLNTDEEFLELFTEKSEHSSNSKKSMRELILDQLDTATEKNDIDAIKSLNQELRKLN